MHIKLWKTKGIGWRRINVYYCSGCGRKRYTMKYERFKGKLCRLCKPDIVENHTATLFPESPQPGLQSPAQEQ